MYQRSERRRGEDRPEPSALLYKAGRPAMVLFGLLLIVGGLAVGIYVSEILWRPIHTEDLVFALSCVGAIALGGLGLILYVVYGDLLETISGKIHLEITPGELRVGDEITVVVTFEPRFRGRIGGVFATIRAVKTNMTQWDPHSSIQRRVLYEDRVLLSRATRMVPHQTLGWSRTFKIPRGSPTSYESITVRVDWTVAVRIFIRGWPDARERTRILVQPHRR